MRRPSLHDGFIGGACHLLRGKVSLVNKAPICYLPLQYDVLLSRESPLIGVDGYFQTGRFLPQPFPKPSPSPPQSLSHTSLTLLSTTSPKTKFQKPHLANPIKVPQTNLPVISRWQKKGSVGKGVFSQKSIFQRF